MPRGPSAHQLVLRRASRAARIPDTALRDALDPLKHRLDAPEAPAREHGGLLGHAAASEAETSRTVRRQLRRQVSGATDQPHTSRTGSLDASSPPCQGAFAPSSLLSRLAGRGRGLVGTVRPGRPSGVTTASNLRARRPAPAPSDTPFRASRREKASPRSGVPWRQNADPQGHRPPQSDRHETRSYATSPGGRRALPW